jgi:hypothetical protein
LFIEVRPINKVENVIITNAKVLTDTTHNPSTSLLRTSTPTLLFSPNPLNLKPPTSRSAHSYQALDFVGEWDLEGVGVKIIQAQVINIHKTIWVRLWKGTLGRAFLKKSIRRE